MANMSAHEQGVALEIVRQYLPRATLSNVMGKGGFSFVWRAPEIFKRQRDNTVKIEFNPWRNNNNNNTEFKVLPVAAWELLRVTVMHRADKKFAQVEAENMRDILDRSNSTTVVPKMEILEVRHDRDTAFFVFAMEEVRSTPVNRWHGMFKGWPQRLLEVLLQAGFLLEQQGVVHTDISKGNVMITLRGNEASVYFIDMDGSCVPKGRHQQEFCRNFKIMTPGYAPHAADDEVSGQKAVDVFFDRKPNAKVRVMLFALTALAAYAYSGEYGHSADDAVRIIRKVFIDNYKVLHPDKHPDKMKTLVKNIINLKYDNIAQALDDFPDCTISCPEDDDRPAIPEYTRSRQASTKAADLTKAMKIITKEPSSRRRSTRR